MKKQQPDRPEQKAKKDREENEIIHHSLLFVRENTFNLLLCLV